MKKLLNLNQLPILLTILLSFCGWTFNKISEGVKNVPTIEYQTRRLRSKDGDSVLFQCRLTNLTNNLQFNNISFVFLIDPADWGQEATGNLIAVPPESQIQAKVDSNASNLSFNILRFNPRAVYILQAKFHTLKSNPIFCLNENATQIVILREASPLTFLIKNQEIFYCLLFILLLTLIVIYAAHIEKKSN